MEPFTPSKSIIMPTSFLSPEQISQYGRYCGEPTDEQLAHYFYLSQTDLEWIDKRRRPHNRLGFALQLCTLRFLGTFLTNPIDVPSNVLVYLARQLKIADLACISQYMEREETHWEHADEIQKRLDYKDFHSYPGYFRLVRWLYSKVWLNDERPSVLFDLATSRLIHQKILLPGASVLARLVARIQSRASLGIYRELIKDLTDDQQKALLSLIEIPANERLSILDNLRRAPTHVSSVSLKRALERIKTLRDLEVGQIKTPSVPLSRKIKLAELAAGLKAQSIAQMNRSKQLATLLCFTQHYQAVAVDESLEVFDLLINKYLQDIKLSQKKVRLRTAYDLDRAANILSQACQYVLNPQIPAEQLREFIFAQVPEPKLQTATQRVVDLTAEAEDNSIKVIAQKYRSARRFLPYFLQLIRFSALPTAQPILDAIHFIKEQEEQKTKTFKLEDTPQAFIPDSWKQYIYPTKDQISKPHYIMSLMEQLRLAIRRRDMFVKPSLKWTDPRRKLLQGEAWKKIRSAICRGLDRSEKAQDQLALLQKQLDECYYRTEANLENNSALRIEKKKGKDRFVLTPLEAQEGLPGLKRLKEKIQALTPQVDLPQLIMEVNNWTGFDRQFLHLNERQAQVKNFETSLCAVLLAEACNIGVQPIHRPNNPALSSARLNWVKQNYLHAENLVKANVNLVGFQYQLPLAGHWGGGEVASADGMRFIVPVRTINARPNSKYFGPHRGVTYYNFTSNQFTGFHSIVIPGTIRDSMYILSGLLEQQTDLEPVQVMADTAGYSDIVFGLFYLLGYQFSPRIADTGSTRFWRMDRNTDYGQLNGIARHKINVELIKTYWDDMLRLAGSLKTGKVRAHQIIQILQRGGYPNALGKAVRELGRIIKTIHSLTFVDDEHYRRNILNQLNRGESRHGLARAIFHGQKGQIRKRYTQGQENQLEALGLVMNMAILWNTRYMQLAIDHLRHEGLQISPQEIARLSPLGQEHINMLGRYSFNLDSSVAQGNLRPLRDSNQVDEWLGLA